MGTKEDSSVLYSHSLRAHHAGDTRYEELLDVLISMEERIREIEKEIEYERTLKLEAGE